MPAYGTKAHKASDRSIYLSIPQTSRRDKDVLARLQSVMVRQIGTSRGRGADGKKKKSSTSISSSLGGARGGAGASFSLSQGGGGGEQKKTISKQCRMCYQMAPVYISPCNHCKYTYKQQQLLLRLPACATLLTNSTVFVSSPFLFLYYFILWPALPILSCPILSLPHQWLVWNVGR